MIVPGANFMQVCWVVDDVDAATRRWHETTGVGPFFHFRSPPIGNYLYRGEPGTLDISVGLAQAGPILVELIQQHGDARSAYRDVRPYSQQHFHHLAILPEDYEETRGQYMAHGHQEVHSGLAGTAKFSYFDVRSELGCMIELIERDEAILALFKAIADAANEWDGSKPFREIGELEAAAAVVT